MQENKTQATEQSVEEFLNNIEDPNQKKDCIILHKLMKEITKSEGKMWGDSIAGYGDYHYKYASGREGDWFKIGFSPRKGKITIYLSYGFESNIDLMSKLGKHKTAKACLYIKKIEDIDQTILKELMIETINKIPGATS